jgi:hypothetical protein
VERVLGPNHRLTLMARFHLVHWTGEAGDAARARELFITLVDEDVRMLGPDDPWTPGATWPVGQRRPVTSRMLAAVEKGAERALGPGYRGNPRGRSRQLTMKT